MTKSASSRPGDGTQYLPSLSGCKGASRLKVSIQCPSSSGQKSRNLTQPPSAGRQPMLSTQTSRPSETITSPSLLTIVFENGYARKLSVMGTSGMGAKLTVFQSRLHRSLRVSSMPATSMINISGPACRQNIMYTYIEI